MSILYRNFIKQITTVVPTINNYDEYENYLKTGVQKLLQAELLSHIFEGGGCDITTYLMYKYEDKYILIDIWMGSCEACNGGSHVYNSIIEKSLETCYVTTNLEDIENYYLKCLNCLESDWKNGKKEHLYFVHPEWSNIY